MQHLFELYITPVKFPSPTNALKNGKNKFKVKHKVNSIEILKIKKQIQMW